MRITARAWLILLHYFILLSKPIGGARDCGLLVMMDGGDRIDSSQLCTTEFVTSECLPFVQSNNVKDLPAVFQDDVALLGKPSNLNIVGLVNDFVDHTTNIVYKVPGLQIKWDSPDSDNVRRHVKGYLFIWQYAAKTACKLFHFNSSSPLLLKKINFSYDIQFLYSGGAHYTVRLNSVRSHQALVNEDEGQLDMILLSSFGMYKSAADPALWTPSLSTKLWTNGSIEIRFTLSPPEFNFTQFDILLVKEKFSISDFYMMQSYLGKIFSLEEPEGIVQFNGLQSDRYHVIVRPFDPLRLDENQCLCWRYIENSLCPADKCCEASCASMVTQWFQLNVTDSANASLVTEQMSLTSVETEGVTHNDSANPSFVTEQMPLTSVETEGATHDESQIHVSDITDTGLMVSLTTSVKSSGITYSGKTELLQNTVVTREVTHDDLSAYDIVVIVSAAAVSLLLVTVISIVCYKRNTRPSVKSDLFETASASKVSISRNTSIQKVIKD